LRELVRAQQIEVFERFAAAAATLCPLAEPVDRRLADDARQRIFVAQPPLVVDDLLSYGVGSSGVIVVVALQVNVELRADDEKRRNLRIVYKLLSFGRRFAYRALHPFL